MGYLSLIKIFASLSMRLYVSTVFEAGFRRHFGPRESGFFNERYGAPKLVGVMFFTLKNEMDAHGHRAAVMLSAWRLTKSFIGIFLQALFP